MSAARLVTLAQILLLICFIALEKNLVFAILFQEI
jgi:hypothetical protein